MWKLTKNHEEAAPLAAYWNLTLNPSPSDPAYPQSLKNRKIDPIFVLIFPLQTLLQANVSCSPTINTHSFTLCTIFVHFPIIRVSLFQLSGYKSISTFSKSILDWLKFFFSLHIHCLWFWVSDSWEFVSFYLSTCWISIKAIFLVACIEGNIYTYMASSILTVRNRSLSNMDLKLM